MGRADDTHALAAAAPARARASSRGEARSIVDAQPMCMRMLAGARAPRRPSMELAGYMRRATYGSTSSGGEGVMADAGAEFAAAVSFDLPLCYNHHRRRSALDIEVGPTSCARGRRTTLSQRLHQNRSSAYLRHQRTSSNTSFVLACLAIIVLNKTSAEESELQQDGPMGSIDIGTEEAERINLWKRMIEAGADMNKASSDGRAPLHFAAENGHAGLVDHLLSAGADVHRADKLGLTALHAAARLGHHTVAARLLTGGADPRAKVTAGKHTGMRALDLAQLEGRHAVAELLAGAEKDLR